MAGRHQGQHERVQDDGRRGAESKCVACEDKLRPAHYYMEEAYRWEGPITTGRRPTGEKGPLLHGGGLQVRRAHYYMEEAYRWEGPIATWRRPTGEKGPLLHGGGLHVRRAYYYMEEEAYRWEGPITTWRRPTGERAHYYMEEAYSWEGPITTWRRPTGEKEKPTWLQVVVAGRHTGPRLILVAGRKMDREPSSIRGSLISHDTSDTAPHFSLHTHTMYIRYARIHIYILYTIMLC